LSLRINFGGAEKSGAKIALNGSRVTCERRNFVESELRSIAFRKYECMKKSPTRYATRKILGLKSTSMLLALTFCVCAMSPRLHAFAVAPPRVRFTGVLVPVNDQSRKGLLEDLNVFIETERSKLLLDKMEVIGGVGLNRPMLQRLFPPLLHFIGPGDLIRRLKSPETSGKVLTIEGLLYTASRTLFLIRVDERDQAST
jgi:hypothetical protein